MTLQTSYLKATAPSRSADGINSHFVLKSRLDFTDTALSSSDTAKALLIKEGWRVDRVYVRLVQIGTVGATVLTGIEDSVNGSSNWIATDMNIGTTGTVNDTKGTLHTDTSGATNGYLFLADAYLIVTISTANFDGILEVAAEIVDLFGGSTIV